jgi:uncharacterized protein YcaQ
MPSKKSDSTIAISKLELRRFILGRQGLWPGRRYAGKSGAAQAIRQAEGIQIDPVRVIARSHELTLWGRVADFRPEHLESLLFEDRAFFDQGTVLFIYPIEELPYFLHAMQYFRNAERVANFMSSHGAVVEEVKEALRTRGPLANRDFTGRAKMDHYRSGKDSGVALYYLWLTGELMTHSRKGNERFYDFRENIIPAAYNHIATRDETEQFFARKLLADAGVTRARPWMRLLFFTFRQDTDVEAGNQILARMMESGEVTQIRVDGQKDPHYMLSADVPHLLDIQAGRIPVAWRPLNTTTQDEVVFLSPLENVSARGRAKILFDFEYIWEIYKPAETRRWGYYTMPVLYGDDLVARIDPKMDRKSMTLVINGFWAEDDAPVADAAFGDALARGLANFAQFHDARKVDLAGIQPPALRKHVKQALGHWFVPAK